MDAPIIVPVLQTGNELHEKAETLLQEAKCFFVINEVTFQRAGLMLRTIKEYLRKVGEVLNPIIQAAHKAHQEALAQKQKIEAPALQAEQALKVSMGKWEEEQRRLAREAEMKATAERERLEDDARLAAALEAEARGDSEQATRVMSAPTPPMPIIVPTAVTPPTPRAEGVSFRSNYTAAVVDLKALVHAVATGQAPITYLQANQQALNQAARAMREELNIPGVRVVVERVAAVRT